MKTGVIVYVLSGEGPYDDFDMEGAVKRLDINADRVETVFVRSNNFDVMDAWWLLTAKGMGLIICKFAEVDGFSKLRLTGRELRLCG